MLRMQAIPDYWRERGPEILTLSDSSGFIYDKDGIDSEKLKYIMELKNEKRVRISEYIKKYSKAITLKALSSAKKVILIRDGVLTR